MTELEFEQKYVLDPRKADEIARAIVDHTLQVVMLRQFYDGGYRYRCTNDRQVLTCYRENKKSIKLNTPYSVSVEEDCEYIDLDTFNKKWDQADRRLRKMRHIMNGMLGQQVMIDFFMPPDCRLDEGNPKPPYAVVAEVETMLTEDTKILYLDLTLPIYLRDFLLKTIDTRDVSSKIFKSANMTETNIEHVERALVQLYEQSL